MCECSYTEEDSELALRYHHMHPSAVASLAQRAGIGELILIHVSDRYAPRVWGRILAEARTFFPHTRFAPEWHAQFGMEE
ncbi:MAG: hypothetical protein H0X24_17730 [Ktedonobacterales bacterium]|nr:hypothetical protein [Ktedonobacterales bacterium]